MTDPDYTVLMEPFSAIVSQLGLGAVGIVLLIWAIGQIRSVYDSRIEAVTTAHAAHVADLKDSHVAHLKLVARVLKIGGYEEGAGNL